MKTRHRISRAEITYEKTPYVITFQPDGLHIKQKFTHQPERIIPLKSLIADRDPSEFKAGSPAERIDVAGCDLSILAGAVHAKQHDLAMLHEVKASTLAALKVIRGLEVIA
jgi:hypothetical protein